jgi:hypothetical protein
MPSATPVVADASAPDAATRPVQKGLVCTNNARLEHRCVPPYVPPVTGQKGAMQDDHYSNYDKNGCIPPSDMKGGCTGVVDLTNPAKVNGQCCYDMCTVPVPCGRPMLVHGAPRLAAATRRGDWVAALPPVVADESVRVRAAQAWLYDARMEHASVAAFSRLSLLLMSVGAPSALVELAHRAAIDEVEHARTCFAIAASLSDDSRSVGPGPLSLEGMTMHTDLRSIALEAAAESCVGETVAALGLSCAAQSCSGAALKSRLRAMAEEELSHAALGFRIVAWALPQLSCSAREEVLAALRVPTYDAPMIATDEADAWRDVGRLTHADMANVERDARMLIAAAKAELSV